MSDERTIRLRVGDARPGDEGDDRARLPTSAMRALQVPDGVLVSVEREGEGGQRIIAIASAAHPEDQDIDLVRIDGSLRRQLGVAMGEAVTVRRYEPAIAEQIRVVSIGAGRLEPDDIRASIGERAIRAGDVIELTRQGGRVDTSVSVLGLDIAQAHSRTTDAEVLVRVVATSPPGIVHVGPDTRIVFDGADADVGHP